MKFLILFVSVFVSAQAMAGLKRICTTQSKIIGYEKEGVQYRFSFEILNIEDEKRVELKRIGWNDEYETDIYVKVKPNIERNPIETLNIDPYARLEKNRRGQVRLKVTADNIGMNYATMVLYKNSDYKRGYILTEMYGEDPEYSAIRCK